MKAARLTFFGGSLIVALAVSGCRREAAAPIESVSDMAERGPLKLIAEAAPKQVWLGDPITVTLRMLAPDDYAVELPGPGAFGTLRVTHDEKLDPRPAAGGGSEWRRTLTLESFSSGTLEIPPLVAKYGKRQGGPGGPAPALDSELATGTLKIDVRSALTSQDSVSQPRDITGTLALPRQISARQWFMMAGAAAGVVGLAYLAFVFIRARRNRPVAPILPEVWALRALAELGATDWVETGRSREYYYRLSEIVRSYIERKFGLAAPEMTTEEFLNTLMRDRQALPYDAERLRQFMQTCDIVKYAAFTPRRTDADEALGTARAFVDATAAAYARLESERAALAAQSATVQAHRLPDEAANAAGEDRAA